MSDLSASGSSGNSGLAYGVSREIVLVNVSLLSDVGVKALNSLCLGERRKSYNVADLCLSAGKHSGTVHSRDQVDFCGERTDLVQFTAVRALVVLKDHLADCLLLILIYSLVQDREPLLFVRESFSEFLSNSGDVALAGLLVIRKYSHFHLCRRNDLADCSEHLFRDRAADIFSLCLSALCSDLTNPLDDLLILLVSHVNIADHILFRDLIGAGFDHDHLISGRSDGQAQIAEVPLLLAGVDDHFAVHKADLGRCAGAVERNIGNCSCQRRADHSDHFGSALRVHTHDHTFKSDVISHILREKRAHGSIDNAACEDRVLAGLAFSLVESAGHLADRVILLAVLNAEREEVNSISGRRRCSRGT